MSSRSLMHHVFPPSKPQDGGYPPSFRLAVGATQLRGSWYLSTIVRLQGFSSHSPVALLRWWSPKTVTSSPGWGEASRAMILVPPSVSRVFVILAGAGSEASRGSTSRAGRRPPLLPASGGGNHPPALRRRRPPAMPGKANCCCPARMQHSALFLAFVARTGARTCRCALERPALWL
jgi:hypothetical protein